jgi:hypothetical protein
MEQKLLISMLKGPTTSRIQKTYRNKTSFYDAIWKLRDAELITNKTLPNFMKEWKLTTDGEIFAKILAK